MTELSIRPVPPMPDSTRPPDDTLNLATTPRRMIDPSDYHQLSPLDALAAQGRLLNKRLNEQSGGSHAPSFPSVVRNGAGLDDSLFPRFGISDVPIEGRVNGRRHRIPGKRSGNATPSESSGSRPPSPTESLSLETLSLGIPDIKRTASVSTQNPREEIDLSRSVSRASSSRISLSTSSDGSATPIEQYHSTRIYQPPPKIEPPRLRPIIKTQQLNRPSSPTSSPYSTNPDSAYPDRPTPTEHASPRPFSPASATTLDRPRLPSLQLKAAADGPPTQQRTQSINFSRPYSSRSSQYSETFSTHEVDYFSPHNVQQRKSTSGESHLSVPGRSPDSESVISSPGLGEEEYAKLPRGRRKSRPMNDNSLFFHSTSMKNLDGAHRWPVTPTSSAKEGERAFFPSPPQSSSSSGREETEKNGAVVGRMLSTRAVSAMDIPPVPVRPKTSGSIVESSSRQKRAASAEVPPGRRPSQVSSSTKPHYTLHPPVTMTQELFNSPTQILHPSRSTSTLAVPTQQPLSAEDHATLGIKFHEQMLLPQATHHFQLAAEGGSPTGMLLYSLSLRHAWGCAANPEKAVEWLHSAAECASAAVDENGVRRPGALSIKDFSGLKGEDGKKGGAMLALAIYEMGQSYMNGWGVEKDKYLALRCFEISANFGDTDGQCETAWCYLNGIGTKKNPKMAARYYRMAERQGVKNVGLSWIWKEKYDDVDDQKKSSAKDIKGGNVRRSATDESGGGGGQTEHKRRKSIFGRKNTA